MAPPSETFFRSDSADSAAPMMMLPSAGPEQKRRGSGGGGGCWLAVAALALLALQVAAASGLFVYFTVALGKLKAEAQGTSEELRCLVLLNRLQDLSNWEELVGNQSCLKMASSIRNYVTGVTEDVIQKSAQAGTMEKFSSEQPLTSQPSGRRPSAHLTLRRLSPVQPEALAKFGELPQSCRHPIGHWADQTMHAHLQNISYRGGQLFIRQPGKYYVYAQVYFRYPTEGSGAQALGRQLVQCVHMQDGSGQNALLLKGVGTKCWAKDATYGLHALYQGGLFDLRAGDRLFVSVSTLDINDSDEAGSYFGAFQLDG
ncbi:tumor necrosis factor ligand superfamily member 10-like [Anolis sagrei]|uniref:tumor necrosis factor ligand superfamily member 10-like n=1 Tax=Anolis sagrei TaxID=38937 RepID=UPI00352012B7